MSDKLRIASKSPLPLRLEVMNDDGTISSQIINPASALPGAPEAVTEDVDADLYHAWLKQNPDHAVISNGMLRELGDEELINEFGFEAGLARAAEDTDNVAASEEGSTITEKPPVSAEALAVPPTAPAAGIASQVGAAPAVEEPVPSETLAEPVPAAEPVAGTVGQPEAGTEEAPVAASTETPAEAETAKTETVSEPASASEPAATEAKTTE